jgi:hypothetical protein
MVVVGCGGVPPPGLVDELRGIRERRHENEVRDGVITLGQREHHLRDTRKAALRLCLRADPAVPDCCVVVGIEPTSYGLKTVALPLSYIEPAHAQNCSRTLRMRLLAGSNSEMVRKPGFAPGPSPSQGEMLLLHHNPDSNTGCGTVRPRTPRSKFRA